MMPEQGPKRPDDRKKDAPETDPFVLLDEEWGRDQSGLVGWFRRHGAAFVFAVVLMLAAGWWVYRTYWHTPVPPPQEITPVQSAAPPGAQAGAEHPVGVTTLSDSMVSGAPGSSTVLTTRAFGSEGNPLANRLVRFRIVQGSGSLGRDTVRTDEEGLARVSLLLPAAPGRSVVSADLVGSPLPGARFSITTQAGTPRNVVIVDGNQQTGSPGSVLPRRLRVRVTDAAGVAVPDVEVRFHVVGGGGVVAPDRVRTDAAGYASAVWRLGNVPGDQHVAALVPDINDVLLTFDAKAVSSAPANAAAPVVSPSVTVVPRSFAVGGSFVCALAGGRVSCRGGNDRGQRLQGSSAGFAAIVAGVSHACALTGDGQAFCWGANESGQLGDGSRIDRARPVAVSTDDRFSVLAAGVSFTCGLAADGRALCWGESIGSQGGEPSSDRLTPQPVAGDHRFVQLVAGWHHACALTAAGNAYCWGRNDHGQLGNGTDVDREQPTQVVGAFQSLTAGNAHTCGIRSGGVLCWGNNSSGQLGNGSTQDRPFPGPVEGLPAPATRLAAGAVSTCALLTTGRVFCWGQNIHGELGDGTRQNRSAPVPVAGELSFRSIYAGGALTCGFAQNGTQYCWGLNQSGQLGDGTRESRSVPTRVGG